jgi:hypothetical protein
VNDLVSILSTLLSTGRSRRALPRGLNLAYTPAAENGGVNRLCLSRLDVYPSEDEDRIVLDHLKRALRESGRVVIEGFGLQPMVKIGRYGATLITWRDAPAAELLSLAGVERKRATRWIEKGE